MIASESRNGHANGRASQAAAPLSTVSDGDSGHNANGRFTAGNRCAAGNPFARRMARLRSVLLDAVSEADLLAVARKLVEQAKGGDTAAAKLLLAYAVGKPTVPVDPDRLDLDEWHSLLQGPTMEEAYSHTRNIHPRDALTLQQALKRLETPVPLFTAEGLALLEKVGQLAKLIPRPRPA